MNILAIDPGKANGIALFDTSKKPPVVFFDTKERNKLWGYLREFEEYDQLTVVVEDYVNRPPKYGGFDHTWDKGYTHRIIGGLEQWAWTNRFEFVLQPASAKTAMYGKLGLPNQHKHHMDAIVHGYIFIEKRRVLPMSEIINALQGAKK